MANLKAVLQRPKVAEHQARNAFDRSCGVNFTYQLGAITPFFCEPFIAGSHVKLNRGIFQRTADVNTPAFPLINTHCEFFAVPIRLLYSYWNNFKLNIQDFNSSLQGSYSGGTFTPTTPQLPYFDIAVTQNQIAGWISNSFNGDTPNLFGSKQQAVEALRLLDNLGYGGLYYSNGSRYISGYLGTFAVNPLKLAAYQKVYYDHFRNTAYESNDPSAYNLDRFNNTSLNNDRYVLEKLCTLRYVNYRKDYFQSIYPALNYTVSNPSGMQWSLSDSAIYKFTINNVSSNVYPSNNSNNAPSGQTVLSFVGNPQGYGDNTIGTVQQIRAAFALDKLLRASAYAPKHVKDQFEARYGVKGVESGNESVRIGAYMNDIVIQEVTDTASQLGKVGGKGVGHEGFNKDIEFTCKEDCIIIGVCYSMPRTSYDSVMLKNWNVKLDREDFFIPEYMDLGMQPIYQHEGYFVFSSATNWNLLKGYKDRYSEYKVGIDTNHGLFIYGEPLSDFVAHSNYAGRWNAVGVPPGLTYDYFKVKVSDLDEIFAQATDAKDMTTDKFITHIDVKCICNQNMSVHGQPSIGGLS